MGVHLLIDGQVDHEASASETDYTRPIVMKRKTGVSCNIEVAGSNMMPDDFVVLCPVDAPMQYPNRAPFFSWGMCTWEWQRNFSHAIHSSSLVPVIQQMWLGKMHCKQPHLPPVSDTVLEFRY